jgi:K+-sensing histidine kinase KdpD
MLHGVLSAGKIRVDVQPQLPATFADCARFKEAIQNLLENAAKCMGDQPELCIEISGYTKDHQVTYRVKDNGIGIAKQYREKVFGMFERLNAGMEGVGMGLALAKRIIETQEGRLWLESDGAGCGAKFFFSLPAQERKP